MTTAPEPFPTPKHLATSESCTYYLRHLTFTLVDCIYSPRRLTYIEYRLRVIMGRVAIPHDRCRLLGYRLTCDLWFSYTWPKYFTSYRRSLYLEWPEVLHEVPTGTNIHSEVIGDAWPHCWKSCDLVWWSVITEESRLVARRASVITEEGMLLPRFEVFLIPTTSKG